MAIKLDIHHPTFELKEKIQDISGSFLKQIGITYFQYLRCYYDGAVSLLTNDTRLLEEFQYIDNKPAVYSAFDSRFANKHSYWFLWDEELPQYPVNLAREKFNIYHGITYVRRAKNYYDMIAFALSENISNPSTFYFNVMPLLSDYIKRFDNEQSGLIRTMHDIRIELPAQHTDTNHKKICLNNGKLTISGEFGISYITAQELTCLRMLNSCETIKHAAKSLNISHRTIETYLNRIKLRTGLSTRKELLTLIDCQ